MKIYCDLDGVLANLPKKIHELTGKPLGIWDNLFWEHVKGSSTLFIDLEPYPGYMEFLTKIKYWYLDSRSDAIHILTAIPKQKREIIDPISQKKSWCRNHIYWSDIDYTFNIGPYGEDKWKYCMHSQDILIDDSEMNIKDWNEKGGGRGILHTSFEDTLAQLSILQAEFTQMK